MKEPISFSTVQKAMMTFDALMPDVIRLDEKYSGKKNSRYEVAAEQVFTEAYAVDPELIVDTACRESSNLFFLKVGTTLLQKEQLEMPVSREAFATSLLRVIQIVNIQVDFTASQKRIVDTTMLAISTLDLDLIKQMMTSIQEQDLQ
ncbi:hypothetical protein [Vibrio harveyi]|uniref:hypothetical protein n=1 Tax=Vibrio harveyi TaxID=669 RepID=UPI003CF23726